VAASRGKWFTRLIALGIILSLLMLGIVSVTTYLAYQKTASDLVVERDKQVIFLSAFRLQAELQKFSQSLQDLARTKEIQNQTLLSAKQALNEVSYRLADFDGGVVLLDNFGRVVTSQPFRPEIMNEDWSDREYFRQVLSTNSAVFSNATEDGPDGSQVVVVSTPIYNTDGQFTGVIAGMFKLGQNTVSSFYASIVRLRLGQTGNTYVVDGNGKILFDSSSDFVGQSYSNPDSMIEPGSSSGAIRTMDESGNDIVASFASIPGTPWYLVTEDDWSILTSPVQKYVNLLLLLVVLGLVIPSTGLWALFRLRSREWTRHSQTEQEMQVARRMKKDILPKQTPMIPGWNLSVVHHSAHMVSGDYYDFMYLPDGRLMLVLAEASDHGLAGMTRIASLRTAIRSAGQRLLTPINTLEESNSLICPEMPADGSIRCLYAIFDFARGQLEFASAGQHEAYICNDSSADILKETGKPLGLAMDTRYQQAVADIKPGHRFLLCNDGVVGLRNSKGVPYGSSRLLDCLGNGPVDGQHITDGIMKDVRKFSGKRWNPEQDLILMVLERIPEGQDR